MAITSEQLDEAAQIVGAAESLRGAAAQIRERLAPLHALVLDAFDMRGETPARRLEQRALYLMSTDGHCWSVTPELARASALVLTQG